MKESQWENLTPILAVVVVAAAVAVAAVAAVAVSLAAFAVSFAVVAAFAVSFAAVAAVAVLVDNPKTACVIFSCVIAVCLLTLPFTLPTALNPPQTIQVICQVTQTASPIIIIQNATTITVTHTSITNQTMTEIVSRSYTC